MGIDFSIASVVGIILAIGEEVVGIILSAWVVGIVLRGAGEVRGIIFKGDDVVGIVLRVGEGLVVGIIFSGPELCCCCGLFLVICGFKEEMRELLRDPLVPEEVVVVFLEGKWL